jgi:hypothetical protein
MFLERLLYKLYEKFLELLKQQLNIEELEKFFQENQKVFQIEQQQYGFADYYLDEMIEKLTKKLSLISSKEIAQNLEKLFDKISNYPIFYYPIFSQIFYEKELNLKVNLNLIKCRILEISKKDWPLLYIWCCMFKTLLSRLTDEKVILNFIKKSKDLNEEYIAKHLVIFTIAMSQNIPWIQKRELFWKWEENPLFLLNEENPLLWTLWEPQFCCEHPRVLEKYLNLPFYLSLCDLFLFLKEIKQNITNEDRKLFQEKVFKNFIDYLKFLNSNIYEDFWSNSESLQRLIEIGLLLSEAEFWNKIIKGLIPYHQKKGKKNEELYKIYLLIETLINEKEIKKEIEKTEAGETPDFTLITQSKKIGIEIVRYDTPEQMKKIAEQEICPFPKHMNFNIPEIFSARVKEGIENKIHKLKNKKSQYDELWLYLVPYSKEAFIEGILAEEIKKFKNENKNEKRLKFEKYFSKIYLLIGSKIHELNKGKEYSINGTLSKVTNLISRKIQNLN